MGNRLNVYVPAPGSDLGIVPGSGIVGTPQDDGLVLIDYEGNLYGASNIGTFEDRIHHAAGRHIMRYPTVARLLVSASKLILIVTFIYEEKCFVENPRMVDEVQAWLDRYEGASHA
jgi:hypothetical protein